MLSARLSSIRKRRSCDARSALFDGFHLFPLSDAGISSGICIDRISLAPVCHLRIWVIPFFFRQLLHCFAWGKGNSAVPDRIWVPLFDDAAMLLFAGDPGLECIDGLGRSLSRERTEKRYGRLPSNGLDPTGSVYCSPNVRNGLGSFSISIAAATTVTSFLPVTNFSERRMIGK